MISIKGSLRHLLHLRLYFPIPAHGYSKKTNHRPRMMESVDLPVIGLACSMTILGPWNILFTSPARFKTSNSSTRFFHHVESGTSWDSVEVEDVDDDDEEEEERSGVKRSLVRRTKYSRKLYEAKLLDAERVCLYSCSSCWAVGRDILGVVVQMSCLKSSAMWCTRIEEEVVGRFKVDVDMIPIVDRAGWSGRPTSRAWQLYVSAPIDHRTQKGGDTHNYSYHTSYSPPSVIASTHIIQ